jgi:hypothetical protein
LVIWVSLLYVSFIEEQNREREKREGLLIVNVKRKFKHSNILTHRYRFVFVEKAADGQVTKKLVKVVISPKY